MLPLVLAGALAASTGAASTPSACPGPRALERLEQRWLAALRTRDRAFLERLLAPDFIDISVHGGRRERAAVLTGPAVPPHTSQHLHDMHVRIHDGTALVDGLNTIHSATRGWTVEVAFTDVFVCRHRRWQALSAQETLQPASPRASR